MGPDAATSLFSADKTNGEEGYKRVLNRLIEDLKQNMDPVAVLDGLVKHGLGTENKRMDIKASARQPKSWLYSMLLMTQKHRLDVYKHMCIY